MSEKAKELIRRLIEKIAEEKKGGVGQTKIKKEKAKQKIVRPLRKQKKSKKLPPKKAKKKKTQPKKKKR